MFTATITFIFVVLGTFITRSGLVQSVHAFAEDPVSTYFFLAIMVASGLAFLLGLLYRHGEIGEDDDQIESMLSKNGSYYLTNIIMVVAGVLVAYLTVESMLSKNGSYYLTNIIMVVAGVLVAYLTVSSALPGWMPLGGSVVAAGAYNAVARPVAVVVVLLMAVCPLLGWRKTEGPAFWGHMRRPLVVAALIFAMELAYFALKLVPTYYGIMADGGAAATALAEQGHLLRDHGRRRGRGDRPGRAGARVVPLRADRGGLCLGGPPAGDL